MQFRSKKIPGFLDAQGSVANSLVMQATDKQLTTLTSLGVTANGDGAASVVPVPELLIPKSVGSKWRVVGVGAYIYNDGASTVAESFLWGNYKSDIGALDSDSFGSFVMDETADKQVKDGDYIYQGVSPFDNYFDFDVCELEGTHVWDISGTGAGVLMGNWQTKSGHLVMTKANVAGSTATGYAFFLVEYELGSGVT